MISNMAGTYEQKEGVGINHFKGNIIRSDMVENRYVQYDDWEGEC